MDLKRSSCILFCRIFPILLLLIPASVRCACVTPTQYPGPAPQLPYLPTTYQVGVECNIIDKGYTMDANVYYDFNGNRAAVAVMRNGLTGKIIYSYETDEIFSISNNNCTVTNLTTSSEIQQFGLLYSNNKPHIGRPQTAFKFGKQLNETYIGNNTIRGIPVSHWQSCTSPPNFTLLVTDYYFSSNWSTATDAASVPIRAEVHATQLLPNGTTYNIHHIYDYFNFRSYLVVDTSTFQTGKDIVCPGRKNSRPLPTLPKRFYYRTEKIYTDLASITFEDTWYDGSFRLFRRDYKPLVPEYPTYNRRPLTEIHDYSNGVRYVIDKSFGNCTSIPLSNYSMDSTQNITASKSNGSFVLNLRNPLQFFKLDWNYVYIGQYVERGVLCDVYVAKRPNLYIRGFVNNANTTITFYFLAKDWTDLADNEINAKNIGTPVKMEMFSDEIGLTTFYNFVDFDPEPPSLDVFDISKCYAEAHKIQFQIKFPGTVVVNTIPTLREWAHLELSQKMGVSIMRISQVRMDYDDANIFVTATLLDKTAAVAQFTYIPGKILEHGEDSTINNVFTPFQCATYCVNNKAFTCNSFTFCSDDKSCHLSRTHEDEGIATGSTRTCDLFSRTVNGLPPERSIKDAFQQLRLHVYNHSLTLNHVMDTSNTYTAVDVTILFGWINSGVKLPQLSDQFSYHIEITIPGTKHVYSNSVWYDKAFKLARYDIHNPQYVFTYDTTNPISIVEDYNTGVKYTMDRVYENCTVDQIVRKDFGSVVSGNSSVNATYHIMMQNPLDLLRIDDNYSFVGQQTVRGMTCNVFESLRTDLQVPNTNKTVTSIFRYSFLAEDWSEISDGYLGSNGQPVRLEISILEESSYTEINIYDFDTDHPDFSLFDIHECFNSNQEKPFQIQFPGSYHPYLESKGKMFGLEAVLKMSVLSGAALLRFQHPYLNYDKDNIYFTATMVEQTNNLLYFSAVKRNISTYFPTNKMMGGVGSVGKCADYCIGNTRFACTKFFYCPNDDQCLLDEDNETSDTQHFLFMNCDQYSKTTTGPDRLPSNLLAFINLKNNIYLRNFTIEIPVSGTDQVKTYTASSVRDDIVTKDGTALSKGDAFKQFNIVSARDKLSAPDSQINNVAIDDCAYACVTSSGYQCNGFSYSLDTLTCSLSKLHTDQNSSLLTRSPRTYIYTRFYIYDYNLYPSLVEQSSADVTIPSVGEHIKCARLCSQYTDFHCKAFQYCGTTQICLLFKSRTVGQPTTTGSTCQRYWRAYEFDFKATNAGLFKFLKALNVVGSLKDCAKFCVEQSGVNCKGFYYRSKTLTCYLTSATNTDGSGIVTTSTDSSDFCEYYTRIYYPQQQNQTSTSSRPSGTSTSTKRAVPTVTDKSSTSNIIKTVASCPPVTMTSSSTSSLQPATGPSPTAQLQSQNDNNGSNYTGSIVGAAFGTFVLGLIIGAAGLYVFRRYRGYRDELQTNFIAHEHI